MKGFDECKQQGLAVQEIVKQHLLGRGIKVIDVSEVPEYQEKDIDFLLEKNGKKTTLEVKQDNNFGKTANVFVEVSAEKETHTAQGWLNYCEAEYICFYDTKTRKGIIVPFHKLVSLLDRGRTIYWFDKTDQAMSEAILVPYSVLVREGAIAHKWED